eukprot:357183-Chlamydomonas_euryale.AAC.3
MSSCPGPSPGRSVTGLSHNPVSTACKHKWGRHACGASKVRNKLQRTLLEGCASKLLPLLYTRIASIRVFTSTHQLPASVVRRLCVVSLLLLAALLARALFGHAGALERSTRGAGGSAEGHARCRQTARTSDACAAALAARLCAAVAGSRAHTRAMSATSASGTVRPAVPRRFKSKYGPKKFSPQQPRRALPGWTSGGLTKRARLGSTDRVWKCGAHSPRELTGSRAA